MVNTRDNLLKGNPLPRSKVHNYYIPGTNAILELPDIFFALENVKKLLNAENAQHFCPP